MLYPESNVLVDIVVAAREIVLELRALTFVVATRATRAVVVLLFALRAVVLLDTVRAVVLVGAAVRVTFVFPVVTDREDVCVLRGLLDVVRTAASASLMPMKHRAKIKHNPLFILYM